MYIYLENELVLSAKDIVIIIDYIHFIWRIPYIFTYDLEERLIYEKR